VYAPKAILHTMSHEHHSLLVVPYTILRILRNISKTALQLSTLTSPKWLTQYSSGDRQLFISIQHFRITEADSCKCLVFINDYTYV